MLLQTLSGTAPWQTLFSFAPTLPYAAIWGKLLSAAFMAALFLQSGIDKVTNHQGNLEWLRGHFAKSPLRNQVKLMLLTVTVTELLAGFLSAAGIFLYLFTGNNVTGFAGAVLASLSLVMLFTGQRIAQDYAGAATIASYFSVGILTMLLWGGVWG